MANLNSVKDTKLNKTAAKVPLIAAVRRIQHIPFIFFLRMSLQPTNNSVRNEQSG